MATRPTVAHLDDLASLLGRELGPSEWIEVSQDLINHFAELTYDSQPIHVDPSFADVGPYGGTIAHGFLTLSLLSRMAQDVIPTPASAGMIVNYGFDTVRFVAPVRAGKRVRGHFTPLRFEPRGPGRRLFVHKVSVEIEGEKKPALVCEWLSLILTKA